MSSYIIICMEVDEYQKDIVELCNSSSYLMLCGDIAIVTTTSKYRAMESITANGHNLKTAFRASHFAQCISKYQPRLPREITNVSSKGSNFCLRWWNASPESH
jgi:hypothetical protein